MFAVRFGRLSRSRLVGVFLFVSTLVLIVSERPSPRLLRILRRKTTHNNQHRNQKQQRRSASAPAGNVNKPLTREARARNYPTDFSLGRISPNAFRGAESR